MMARNLVLMALVAFCTLLFVPAANAWQIERAELVAAKVWHDPCAGRLQLHVSWEPVADAVWAESWPDECRIAIAPDWRIWGWPYICATVIHEYGHLAGYSDPRNARDPSHSDNPRSVMYAFVHPDRRCRDRGRDYLKGVTHE
jgi:hypothetical protein